MMRKSNKTADISSAQTGSGGLVLGLRPPWPTWPVPVTTETSGQTLNRNSDILEQLSVSSATPGGGSFSTHPSSGRLFGSGSTFLIPSTALIISLRVGGIGGKGT